MVLYIVSYVMDIKAKSYFSSDGFDNIILSHFFQYKPFLRLVLCNITFFPEYISSLLSSILDYMLQFTRWPAFSYSILSAALYDFVHYIILNN